VTDFGSKDYVHIGRTLFTLRNGNKHHPTYSKSYAQKLLFNPEGQRAPAHFHLSKMEDIYNLAGGNVLVQLTAATANNQPSAHALCIQSMVRHVKSHRAASSVWNPDKAFVSHRALSTSFGLKKALASR
jgi:D-lyxose ketol-isomerase